MNFDDHQKEIIKAINDKSVYDILSFVKKFGCYELYRIDKDKVQRDFDKREKGKKYPVYVHNRNNPENIDNVEIAYTTADLVFSMPYVIKTNTKRTYFDGCRDEGIYIKTSFDEIKNFISIWEYLKKELEVLEVKKDINEDEMGLFFERVPNEDYSPEINKREREKIPESLEEFDGEVQCKEKIQIKEFLPEKLKCNYDELQVCEYYFDKKILPTPALNNFIKEDFSTFEQVCTKKSLRYAWIAIIISIVATIISIVFSIISIKLPDESVPYLQQMNSSLEEILTEIENLDIPEYDDTDLKESVDGIEESLEKIRKDIINELNK